MGRVGEQIPRWGCHAEAPGLLALWQRQGAGEIEYVAQDHGLVVALSPIERRQTRLCGAIGPMHCAPLGSVNVIPQGADHWGCWGRDKETLYFAMSVERLRGVAASHFRRDDVELFVSNRETVDPVLLNLSQLLRDELKCGGFMTELYADSLAALIAVRMLRRYSTVGENAAPPAPKRGGLSPQARRAVLDFMADRRSEQLAVADIAAVAGLAPSTFLRAFRQEMGVSPHRHLLRLRVERTETLLRSTGLSLAEVALAAGFASQSHMTTVFGQATGVSPGSWRRALSPRRGTPRPTAR